VSLVELSGESERTSEKKKSFFIFEESKRPLILILNIFKFKSKSIVKENKRENSDTK